jgi:hypothetical protein
MNFDTSKDYFYIDNKLIVKDTTFKKIKDYIKKEYEPPKKDVNGYLIKFNVKDTNKEYMRVTVTQITITPKLFIGASDNDFFKVFTYTPEEYKKYGLTENIIKKMMKAVKNNLVSFETDKDSITELIKVTK